MTDNTYENGGISHKHLVEHVVYNIFGEEYPADMTEEQKLKRKKDLEELAEILMEEYGDL
jgi:hypothetical protein